MNPSLTRPPMLGVIGSGSHTPASVLQLAEEVGQQIAISGAVLVCGGRGGVMEAACRGAKRRGGTTVGILPGADTRDANPWVDIPIVTGFGEARNLIIARTAHALIALPGSYGTLTEIAFGLHFATPVVGLQTWHVQRPEDLNSDPILRAETPLEAVQCALKAARERNRLS